MRLRSHLVLLVLAACDEPTGDDGPLDVATTDTDTGTTPPPPEDVCDGHADDTVCDGNDVVTCDAAGDPIDQVPCAPTTTCTDGECVACTPDVWNVPLGDAGVVATRGIVLDVDTTPLAEGLGRSRTVAADQVRRLESAMVEGRSWSAAEFRDLFVGHPLLRHLVRRLVWLSDSEGTTTSFRVADDRAFADVEDSTFHLPDAATLVVHTNKPDPLLPSRLSFYGGQIVPNKYL